MKTKTRNKELDSLTIPSELSVPSDKLQDYIILIYGAVKIGKTSMLSNVEGALFTMFEPGGSALRIRQVPINSWIEFKHYVKLAKKDKTVKTIVIDTAEMALRMCQTHVCEKMAIDHPSDEAWGKGYDAIRNEFLKTIYGIRNAGMGIALISHYVDREIKTRKGESFHKTSPSIPKTGRETLEAIIDIWGFYENDGEKRTLQILGDDYVEAGHRLRERFKYSDGSPIHKIPMGKSWRS